MISLKKAAEGFLCAVCFIAACLCCSRGPQVPGEAQSASSRFRACQSLAVQGYNGTVDAQIVRVLRENMPECRVVCIPSELNQFVSKSWFASGNWTEEQVIKVRAKCPMDAIVTWSLSSSYWVGRGYRTDILVLKIIDCKSGHLIAKGERKRPVQERRVTSEYYALPVPQYVCDIIEEILKQGR